MANLASEFVTSRGVFITGTDTGVGKTHVACALARALRSRGTVVGVYKPAASGGRRVERGVVCADAELLWRAAGCPLDLDRVCPQQFEAPVAPYLAAEQEGRTIDEHQLASGADVWKDRSDFLIVEGAGGLMSPVGPALYNANIAQTLGYPILVVAANRLGVINQVLQTLIAAEHYGLPVRGVLLNDVDVASGDPSRALNARELSRHVARAPLATLAYGADVLSAELFAMLVD